MKRSFLLCLGLMAFTFLCFGPLNKVSQAKSDKFKKSQNPVPDQYIVVLEDFFEQPNAIETAAADLNYLHQGKMRHVFTDALKGYSVEMTEHEARLLAEDPYVKFVEQDSYVSAAETVTSPGWALDRIDQRNLPFDNQYTYTSSGVGVNVYVIDSGILTTHQALSGRAFDDYDAVRDQYDPMTCNGHGTGVAGVVGSSNFGVARNVLLHSVRVFPCTGDASLSDVVSAVDWVTRHAVKPAVVNMSLRASFSQTLNSAVSASIRSGVTYVVAAGNDEADACNYSPGSVGEVITVGSTNSVDQRVYYSNFGSCVDLFAPGEGVATIWNSTDTTTTYASGTSFASPNAAGVAALYLEMNPGATPAEVQAALVNNASSGVIYNLGNTSPNLLLFSDFVGSAPTPTPSPSPSPSPSPLPSPSPAPISCVGSEFRGSLSSTGSFAYQSSKTGFAARQGILSGSLNVPVGSNFRLYLEKKSGGNRDGFTTILSSTGGSSTETVTYRAKNGTYRWRIESQAGSGAYSLCTQTP